MSTQENLYRKLAIHQQDVELRADFSDILRGEGHDDLSLNHRTQQESAGVHQELGCLTKLNVNLVQPMGILNLYDSVLCFVQHAFPEGESLLANEHLGSHVLSLDVHDEGFVKLLLLSLELEKQRISKIKWKLIFLALLDRFECEIRCLHYVFLVNASFAFNSYWHLSIWLHCSFFGIHLHDLL